MKAKEPTLAGFPKGLPLIRLRIFLEILGYKVKEIKQLATKPSVYHLAEMLAFGTLTPDAAVTILQYSCVQDVYRLVLRGMKSPIASRKKILEGLWEEQKSQVEQRRRELQEVIGVSPLLLEREASIPIAFVPTKKKPTQAVSLGRNTELETLGHLVLAALPLAEKIASNDFSEEDRKKLRQITGGDAVYRLSNAMNQLCGEKARNQIRADAGQKDKL